MDVRAHGGDVRLVVCDYSHRKGRGTVRLGSGEALAIAAQLVFSAVSAESRDSDAVVMTNGEVDMTQATRAQAESLIHIMLDTFGTALGLTLKNNGRTEI